MKRTHGFLYVASNTTDQLIQNVSQTLKNFPDAQIVVVDISSQDVSKHKAALHDLSGEIEYIQSKDASRFHAFNLGLAALDSQWAIFRTDTDMFHEQVTHALTTIYPEADIIVANYSDEGVLHSEMTMDRPIESVIFRSEVLAQAGAFDAAGNSDAQYMNNLPTSLRVVHSPEVILEKK